MIRILLLLLALTPTSAREVSLELVARGYSQYKFFIHHYSDKHKIDYCIVTAVIAWESEFKPNAEYYGCNGLMQVKGGSFDVHKNINAGCSILAKCFKAFPQDTLMALTAYNRGIAGAKRLGKPNYFAKKVYELFKLTKLLLEGWRYEGRIRNNKI